MLNAKKEDGVPSRSGTTYIAMDGLPFSVVLLRWLNFSSILIRTRLVPFSNFDQSRSLKVWNGLWIDLKRFGVRSQTGH